MECETNLFKYSISSLQMISNQFLRNIIRNRNLTFDFINRPLNSRQAEKSLVSVNIFYSSLSHTVSRESPKMETVSLLASIGGHLSLFLGVSVFSLCETVEVAIEIFYVLKR